MLVSKLSYIPYRINFYGDKGVGKTYWLKQNFLHYSDDSLYLDFYAGEDLSGVKNLFIDNIMGLEDLNISYIFTTNKDKLEGFYNIPIFSKTNMWLLSQTDVSSEIVRCSAGSMGLLNEMDIYFRQYWKGFCKVIFNFNQNTKTNSLKYLENFDKSSFFTWLIFVRLIIEKGNSNVLILSRIKSFSALLFKCVDRLDDLDFKETFVGGIYAIYNNIERFPYSDKLNSLLNCVD